MSFKEKITAAIAVNVAAELESLREEIKLKARVIERIKKHKKSLE